jgi:hypothetical protein
MVWPLIRRGLLIGALAGLLAGCFAFVFGEPLVQDAIDIEEAASAQAALQLAVPARVSDWVVSRDEQRGGLFLGTLLYGLCIGTVFALAFAVLRGRGAQRDDWQLSTRLAAALFVVFVLIPFLKYPANPPAVGDPDTIGDRTWAYLALLAGSIAALVAAARVTWSVGSDAPVWRAPLLGGGTFLVLVAFLMLVLPGVDEVPEGFPASLLWEFRLSSLGTQAVLWSALGVGYGIASLRGAPGRAPATA